MNGSPVTSGLSTKRSSAWVSLISSGWPENTAWAHIDAARGVSAAASPTRALNHWRSASTRLTSAIGVPHSCRASSAISVNAGSGSVSRIPQLRSAARRWLSLSGIAAAGITLLIKPVLIRGPIFL